MSMLFDSLTEKIVLEISRDRREPDWLLHGRLEALKALRSGGSLETSEFGDIDFRPQPAKSTPKEPFQEEILRRAQEDLEKQGIVFLGMEAALAGFPDLFKKYFGSAVSPANGAFAALNAAAWSGGGFVYVPKGVHAALPLQSDLRPNAGRPVPCERTLIVADEGSSVHYIEGCSASLSAPAALYAGVVELIALPGSHIRYTTLQNWPKTVFNRPTKRAIAYEDAHVEWIEVHVGSKETIKQSAIILAGARARGDIVSCALAGAGQRQDIGGKLIFAAPATRGSISVRAAAREGGSAVGRHAVTVDPRARDIQVRLRCDALLLDDRSHFSAYPADALGRLGAEVDESASVSDIGAETLFYLMSRGLGREQAVGLLAEGFFEPFARDLPLEYAVEFNRLLHLELL